MVADLVAYLADPQFSEKRRVARKYPQITHRGRNRDFIYRPAKDLLFRRGNFEMNMFR